MKITVPCEDEVKKNILKKRNPAKFYYWAMKNAIKQGYDSSSSDVIVSLLDSVVSDLYGTIRKKTG